MGINFFKIAWHHLQRPAGREEEASIAWDDGYDLRPSESSQSLRTFKNIE